MFNLHQNLEIMDFLTEMFNNKDIEVDLRSRYKSCIQFFERESGAKYGDDSFKNPGKEIEKMFATTIRSNMNVMVDIRDDVDPKAEVYDKKTDLIFLNGLELSVKSCRLSYKNKIIIDQREYDKDLKNKKHRFG
jgi:hypothetical protein